MGNAVFCAKLLILGIKTPIKWNRISFLLVEMSNIIPCRSNVQLNKQKNMAKQIKPNFWLESRREKNVCPQLMRS